MLASPIPGFGQVLPDWTGQEQLPEPPAFGVLDDSGFFSRNPEALMRISDMVRGLDKRHGFKIYVVVETILGATNAMDYALKLQHAWLPEGGGLVVVYQTDTRSLGFGRELNGEANLISEGRKDNQVPTYESLVIISSVTKAMDVSATPDVYLETLVADLVSGYDLYFDRLDTPAPKGRALRLGLLTIGGISLVGLAVLGIAWLMRRSGMEVPLTFRFPEIEVRERLGAPYGGGNVSSRRFGEDAGNPR